MIARLAGLRTIQEKLPIVDSTPKHEERTEALQHFISREINKIEQLLDDELTQFISDSK